jgi:N-acetylglucosaminyldiphosphoundecaprenol N-acetyl-beta-D-mannosaminyltransferase
MSASPLHPPSEPAAPLARPHALPDFDREVDCLLGLPVDAIDMAGAVRRVRDAAFSGRPCFISTPNLNFLIAARDDPAFRDSVLHSDLIIADGMPLVWIARLLGARIRERVAGSELFERLRDHRDGPPVSLYFFGGPDGAAERACQRINESATGLRCVGFESPGFVPLDEMTGDDSVARINASGAQFVSVSLGAKKGQAWIERMRGRLDAPVLCHLGAVVNFASGSVQRAPRWVQACALEWLWRIKEEPGLWRRYWNDGRALLAVLLTRVLPAAWYARRWAPAADAPPSATLSSAQDARGVRLSLGGAWTRAALPPLRQALQAAAAQRLPVSMSLAGVSYVDNAFLGLLLVARGALGDHLPVHGASARVARLFHYQGAGFLLATPASCAA